MSAAVLSVGILSGSMSVSGINYCLYSWHGLRKGIPQKYKSAVSHSINPYLFSGCGAEGVVPSSFSDTQGCSRSSSSSFRWKY